MIAPDYMNAADVNDRLNYFLRGIYERFDVKAEATLNAESDLNLLDVSLVVSSGFVDSRFFEVLSERIAHFVRFIQGRISVILWVESREFPVVSQFERRYAIRDHEILYRGTRRWSLRELIQIQSWADLAYAGMHSNSATGMGVGGRRFRWLMDELGFTRAEAEVLCRLNFEVGSLRRAPNGIYIGQKGSVVPPREDIE